MTTFNTSREIAAPIDQVFAAISDPERLAKWWGPAGFTNVFETCEFTNGGLWKFVMNGPDGKHYANENSFEDIEPPTQVVVRHDSEPKYRLTISLTSSANGTLVSWSQAFENDEVARRLEKIVVPANDQNLERLENEVLHGGVGG